MKKVLILAASNGKNLELSKKIEKAFEDKVTPEIVDLVSYEFPLFSTATESFTLTDSQQEVVDKVVASDYFIFVAPEYNGGIPPVLTNFITWVTQRAGDDWRKAFNSKLAGLASFSGSNGNQLMSTLMIMLNHLGVDVMGRKLISCYSSEISTESIHDFCERFVNRIKSS